MALGEAFINVRADLKPFAKDLEKGLKQILLAAERKMIADAQSSGGLAAALRKQTSDGVSDGLEDGYEQGTKRGTRKALTGAAKFFAALGDFADDGLSALPSEVKAALVVGVVGASAVIAPLLAGAVSGAITAGVGAGVIGLGIALATQFDDVQRQFDAVGQDIKGRFTNSARFFIDPLIAAGEKVADLFADSGDLIDKTFSQAAFSIEPLTEAITGLVRELLPGIEIAVRKARPLIMALAQALPQLGRDLATAFAILADGSPEAVVALRDILNIIGTLIIVTATFIRALSDLWFWLRVIGEARGGNMAGALALLAEREQNATIASGQLSSGLEPLNTNLDETADAADAARLAISGLVNQQLQGIDATLDYEAAIDNLQKSIKEGNKDFRETNENGRTNLRYVQQAIQSAALIRDSEIAKARETGRSTDSIEADYRRQINIIETTIGKNRAQGEALKDMFRIAREGPKKVEIEVSTPGLDAATARWKALGAAIRAAISRSVSAGVQYLNGSGLQTAVQKKYALGGIVNGPTNALIGEAGYREAVIPDPAVMPGRAMELSKKFGLTSMIADALGTGQTVVNVFIGQERLEQIADYRIGLNNMYQAQSLAYGPRP